MKKVILLIIVFLSTHFFSISQSTFSFTPEKPKPGDKISFRYQPEAGVFSESDVITCIADKWGIWCDTIPFMSDGRSYKPVEIKLAKKGNYYEGIVQTDTLTRMVSFSFSTENTKWRMQSRKKTLVEGKVDNNHNIGYCIPFYNSDGTVCQYTHFLIGGYIDNNFHNDLGIENPEKAMEHYQLEQQLYADAKYYALPGEIRCYPPTEKEKVKLIAGKEIEKLFATGLKSENDMRLLANLSLQINLPRQYQYFSKLSRETFKDKGGIETLLAMRELFYNETDAAKKINILNELVKNYNSAGFEKRMNLPAPAFYYWNLLVFLTNTDKTEELKTYLEKFNYQKEDVLMVNDLFFFKMVADTLQAHGKAPALLDKYLTERYNYCTSLLSGLAKGIALPKLNGSEYYTQKEKVNALAACAAVVADKIATTYSDKGDDKTAWKYAREANHYLQMTTSDVYTAKDINSRYCLLGEKMLPAKKCRTEVEKVVLSGAWKPDMLDLLKRLWIKEHKSELGYDEYVKSLRQVVIDETKKTLLASQLNEVAPQFVLKDINGKEVSLQDFKGKTLVLDFWATWCGPCKASFPGMQMLVDYYKNNPNVKFLFIDTWESKNPEHDTDEKKLKAVTDYINEKKYSFHVLMDNESKTVVDYKVEGIPTKFIIDKDGKVRYKVLGFEPNEGKLVDEMNGMIESIK